MGFRCLMGQMVHPVGGITAADIAAVNAKTAGQFVTYTVKNNTVTLSEADLESGKPYAWNPEPAKVTDASVTWSTTAGDNMIKLDDHGTGWVHSGANETDTVCSRLSTDEAEIAAAQADALNRMGGMLR
jgi:hypothetical protein